MVTIKENYSNLVVLGKLDDPKVYLCRKIAEYLEKKIGFIVEFITLFETQFVAYREDLIKKEESFTNWKDSPIIYERTDKGYHILGSLENFTRWACAYHAYVEEKLTNQFIEEQMISLRKSLDKLGNKYAFFNIKLGDNLINKKIIIELFFNKCPKTCENFLRLCQGFKSKSNEFLSYERTYFHRVVKNSFIQGGDLNQLKISKSILT